MDYNDTYLRPEDLRKYFKVTSRTILNWTYNGKLPFVRTKGGQRRYLLSDIQDMLPDRPKLIGRRICYCRVSTRSQKEDLERQVEYFHSKYPEYEIVRDIGSGLNFKRKGFNSILDDAIKGNIREIVVTHRDRLCRFGFELIERLVQQYSNGEIVVLDKQKTSPQEELVNDLLSIVTVFSSRLYGLRSHSIKKELKAIQEENARGRDEKEAETSRNQDSQDENETFTGAEGHSVIVL